MLEQIWPVSWGLPNVIRPSLNFETCQSPFRVPYGAQWFLLQFAVFGCGTCNLLFASIPPLPFGRVYYGVHWLSDMCLGGGLWRVPCVLSKYLLGSTAPVTPSPSTYTPNLFLMARYQLQSRTKCGNTRFNFGHFSKYHQSCISYYVKTIPKQFFFSPPVQCWFCNQD